MARRSSKLSLIFLLFVACIMGGGGYMLFQDTDAPTLTFSHNAEAISLSVPLTVTATDRSGIKRIAVFARYQENEISVADIQLDDAPSSKQISFTLDKTGLKNGDAFDLEVIAVDNSLGSFGFGNKAKLIKPMRADTELPRVTVKTSPPYVRKGGTGSIAFSISKEAISAGVDAGGFYFPAFRQNNGDFICFFGFPYNMELKDYSPSLKVRDVAGNAVSMPLEIRKIDRKFKSDTIEVSQGFLDAKKAEFAQMAPGDMSDIERFLKVNGQIRQENAIALLEIGKDTVGEMLWQGAFLRLPRAASRAGFADHRTYLWQGESVDQQTHLGFDLASTRQAPIPASNSGRVVFAGYLGIYGYLIVIDHGMGLQSLYSHLSEIGVQEGQTVNKGDIIGKTGASGMAGGDHLHYGILVSGLEVTPLEWLDDHWIKDNVVDRINEAGGTAPAFTVEPVQQPPQQQPKQTKPQRSGKKRR